MCNDCLVVRSVTVRGRERRGLLCLSALCGMFCLGVDGAARRGLERPLEGPLELRRLVAEAGRLGSDPWPFEGPVV